MRSTAPSRMICHCFGACCRDPDDYQPQSNRTIIDTFLAANANSNILKSKQLKKQQKLENARRKSLTKSQSSCCSIDIITLIYVTVTLVLHSISLWFIIRQLQLLIFAVMVDLSLRLSYMDEQQVASLSPGARIIYDNPKKFLVEKFILPVSCVFVSIIFMILFVISSFVRCGNLTNDDHRLGVDLILIEEAPEQRSASKKKLFGRKERDQLDENQLTSHIMSQYLSRSLYPGAFELATIHQFQANAKGVSKSSPTNQNFVHLNKLHASHANSISNVLRNTTQATSAYQMTSNANRGGESGLNFVYGAANNRLYQHDDAAANMISPSLNSGFGESMSGFSSPIDSPSTSPPLSSSRSSSSPPLSSSISNRSTKQMIKLSPSGRDQSRRHKKSKSQTRCQAASSPLSDLDGAQQDESTQPRTRKHKKHPSALISFYLPAFNTTFHLLMCFALLIARLSISSFKLNYEVTKLSLPDYGSAANLTTDQQYPSSSSSLSNSKMLTQSSTSAYDLSTFKMLYYFYYLNNRLNLTRQESYKDSFRKFEKLFNVNEPILSKEQLFYTQNDTSTDLTNMFYKMYEKLKKRIALSTSATTLNNFDQQQSTMTITTNTNLLDIMKFKKIDLNFFNYFLGFLVLACKFTRLYASMNRLYSVLIFIHITMFSLLNLTGFPALEILYKMNVPLPASPVSTTPTSAPNASSLPQLLMPRNFSDQNATASLQIGQPEEPVVPESAAMSLLGKVIPNLIENEQFMLIAYVLSWLFNLLYLSSLNVFAMSYYHEAQQKIQAKYAKYLNQYSIDDQLNFDSNCSSSSSNSSRSTATTTTTTTTNLGNPGDRMTPTTPTTWQNYVTRESPNWLSGGNHNQTISEERCYVNQGFCNEEESKRMAESARQVNSISGMLRSSPESPPFLNYADRIQHQMQLKNEHQQRSELHRRLISQYKAIIIGIFILLVTETFRLPFVYSCYLKYFIYNMDVFLIALMFQLGYLLYNAVFWIIVSFKSSWPVRFSSIFRILLWHQLYTEYFSQQRKQPAVSQPSPASAMMANNPLVESTQTSPEPALMAFSSSSPSTSASSTPDSMIREAELGATVLHAPPAHKPKSISKIKQNQPISMSLSTPTGNKFLKKQQKGFVQQQKQSSECRRNETFNLKKSNKVGHDPTLSGKCCDINGCEFVLPHLETIDEKNDNGLNKSSSSLTPSIIRNYHNNFLNQQAAEMAENLKSENANDEFFAVPTYSVSSKPASERMPAYSSFNLNFNKSSQSPCMPSMEPCSHQSYQARTKASTEELNLQRQSLAASFIHNFNKLGKNYANFQNEPEMSPKELVLGEEESDFCTYSIAKRFDAAAALIESHRLCAPSNHNNLDNVQVDCGGLDFAIPQARTSKSQQASKASSMRQQEAAREAAFPQFEMNELRKAFLTRQQDFADKFEFEQQKRSVSRTSSNYKHEGRTPPPAPPTPPAMLGLASRPGPSRTASPHDSKHSSRPPAAPAPSYNPMYPHEKLFKIINGPSLPGSSRMSSTDHTKI